MSTHVANNNQTGIHYNIATMTRIFTIFRPLEEIEDDFEKEYVPYPSFKDNLELQQEANPEMALH